MSRPNSALVLAGHLNVNRSWRAGTTRTKDSTQGNTPHQTNKGLNIMPDKSPESFGLITYAWVLGLSILGGIAAFSAKVKSGEARLWNFTELVGEMTTSAFAGIVTFYLCTWSSFSPLLTAAMVGIAGHMGSRAIFLIEKAFENKLSDARK